MVTVGKDKLGSGAGIQGALGIAGKTISTIDAFRHGVIDVLDIYCTDTNHYYVKFRQGQVEIGGTADWGTGALAGNR